MIVKSLSDGDGYNDEENISENWVKEGYLFSPDSKQNIFETKGPGLKICLTSASWYRKQDF